MGPCVWSFPLHFYQGHHQWIALLSQKQQGSRVAAGASLKAQHEDAALRATSGSGSKGQDGELPGVPRAPSVHLLAQCFLRPVDEDVAQPAQGVL